MRPASRVKRRHIDRLLSALGVVPSVARDEVDFLVKEAASLPIEYVGAPFLFPY